MEHLQSKSTHYQFKNQNRLEINTSFRTHICETCKKRFTTSSKLNIHKRIHLKPKRFTCDQCQMSFSLKCNLTTHKRTHTGERPYS
jgi:KRAB domain-containing zinc finger protein